MIQNPGVVIANTEAERWMKLEMLPLATPSIVEY